MNKVLHITVGLVLLALTIAIGVGLYSIPPVVAVYPFARRVPLVPSEGYDSSWLTRDQRGITSNGPLRIQGYEYLFPRSDVQVQFSDKQQFGIALTAERDQDNPESPLLTADERGQGNHTRVRIDGHEYVYGDEIPGIRWARQHGQIMKEAPVPGKDYDRAWQSVMYSELGKIRITQTVEILPGFRSDRYDAVLVKYRLANEDRKPHAVGLRYLLSTFLRAGEGSFHAWPRTDVEPVSLDSPAVMQGREVPQLLRALALRAPRGAPERAVLYPIIGGSDPMAKLVVCRRPHGDNAPWEWDFEALDLDEGLPGRSCVVMYWPEVTLAAGEHRDVGFIYGTDHLRGAAEWNWYIAQTGPRMRLFCTRARLAKPFLVTCYVRCIDPAQQVTLRLPDGLTLTDGQTATRTVGPMNDHGYIATTWRVQARREGTFALTADAPGIGIAEETVRIFSSIGWD